MASFTTVTLVGILPSNTVELKDRTLVRISMPEAWDDSDIEFLESYDETLGFQPFYNDFGDRVRLPVDANRMVAVDPRRFQSSRRIKLVSVEPQAAPRLLRLQIVQLAELVYVQGGLAGIAA